MPRPARPDDLYRLAVPYDPRLSPDGRTVAFTVKVASAGPRRLPPVRLARPGRRLRARPAAHARRPDRTATRGSRRTARRSPSSRTAASYVEEEPDRPKEREGARGRDAGPPPAARRRRGPPPDGPAARRDRVRLVARRQDARRAHELARRDPRRGGAPPRPAAQAQARRAAAVRLPLHRPARLPVQRRRASSTTGTATSGWSTSATGAARPLVAGPTPEATPAWSPDGTPDRVRRQPRAGPRPRRRARRSSSVDVASRRRDDDRRRHRRAVLRAGVDPRRVLDPRRWASGSRAAATAPACGGSPPTASDARPGGGTDLLAASELKPDAGDEQRRDDRRGRRGSWRRRDGEHALFRAPVDGSYELWRVRLDGGEPERLTTDRHYLSALDAVAAGGTDVVAAVRSAGDGIPGGRRSTRSRKKGGDGAAHGHGAQRGARGASSRSSSPSSGGGDETPARGPGLAAPGRRRGKQPLVLEIHGGPHTLYGWSPILEWQILAGSGVSVLATNPRGSEGYGEAFNRGNLGDWGDGPMADVIAGVDQAIADGLADPDRLGVTGGSYGGYLTNWIIGRTQRFKAALTCRSVVGHGDAVPDRRHLGRRVGEDRVRADPVGRTRPTTTRSRRSRSPTRSARRCSSSTASATCGATIAQAEALFTVLRSLKRPVRFMRVPDESHELTRSGTPFRRRENLVQVQRLVRALPGQGRDEAAGAAQEPRRPLASGPSAGAAPREPSPDEREARRGTRAPARPRRPDPRPRRVVARATTAADRCRWAGSVGAAAAVATRRPATMTVPDIVEWIEHT